MALDARLLSKEIIADQELIMPLSKSSAEQRLAALLLSLSARQRFYTSLFQGDK